MAYTAQSKRYKSMGTAFLVMILIYLLFHIFLSERSIPSLISLSLQEATLEDDLKDLDVAYADLTDKVTRLRPETLDPDLAEEYAIKMLGTAPGQGIIMIDQKS